MSNEIRKILQVKIYVEKGPDYTFKFSHLFYIHCKRYRRRLKKSEFFTVHANGSCKIDNGRYVRLERLNCPLCMIFLNEIQIDLALVIFLQ